VPQDATISATSARERPSYSTRMTTSRWRRERAHGGPHLARDLAFQKAAESGGVDGHLRGKIPWPFASLGAEPLE